MTETLNLAQDAIALALKSGADAADAIIIDSTDSNVTCRLGKVETLERAQSKGLGLRVFVGNRLAVVSSSDTSMHSVAELVERAVAMARAVPEDAFASLAPEEQLARTLPKLDIYDTFEPTAEALFELARTTEDHAITVPGITNTEGADAGYSASHVALAASNGFTGTYSASGYSLSVSVLAEENGQKERDYDYSYTRHFRDLRSAESIGLRAAERAKKRLGGRKVKTCSVPVVFDPRVARGLLSQFTAAISGAAIARKTSFLQECLHTQIFPEAVSIVDDPTLARGLASRPFDAEGIAAAKRALVENGILATWLLDVRSANQLGLRTTGHASRGIAGNPSPSPSNVTLLPSTITPAGLMADIKQGLYVTEVFGMGINLITGDYSQGAGGFWIENGALTYPVSEVTIASTLQEMFRSLAPANDLEFEARINTPTLRVGDMMVAGS